MDDEDGYDSTESGSESEIVTRTERLSSTKKKLLFKERPPSSTDTGGSEMHLSTRSEKEGTSKDIDNNEPLLSATYPSRMSLMIIKGDIDPKSKERISSRINDLNASLKRDSGPFKSLYNLQSSLHFKKDPLSNPEKETDNIEDEVIAIDTGDDDDDSRKTKQSQVRKLDIRKVAMQYRPTDLKSIRNTLAESSRTRNSIRLSFTVGPSGKPRIRRRSRRYFVQRDDKATQTIELCDLTQCQIDQLNWDPFNYWETQCSSLDRALKFTKMCKDPKPIHDPPLVICGEHMELLPREPDPHYFEKTEYIYPRQIYFNRYRTDFETRCVTLHLF